MDGLKRLRTPGLILSAILHGIGLLLLWFSIQTGQPTATQQAYAASGQETSSLAKRDSSSTPWQTIQQPAVAAYVLKGSLSWWALGCWLASFMSLVPSFLYSFRRTQISSSGSYHEADYDDLPFMQHPLCHAESSPAEHYKKLRGYVDELEKELNQQPVQAGDAFFAKSHHNNIEHLESQTKLMYNSITNTQDNVQKTVNRVQRLFHQCRESANFAASNRLDWKKNTMLGNLSQVRQSHDKVLDTSKNIAAIHASAMRLLSESIQGETIFYDKIARVQEYLDQVQNSSHIGYRAHDEVIAVIGESRDGVANAAKLVNGLAQKVESLLAIVKQVDDIAEKINMQALNASVALSRNKGSQVDVGFATEFRGLAARFHTQSRRFQELTESVHREIEKSLHHLAEAGNKAEAAFASVNECGELYRNNVSATKYGLSELALLHKEVGIHMKKLGETKDLGDSAADLMQNLDKQLSGYNEMNKRISEETNQMVAHSDKLSHLLSKQYYELSHCEKMLADSAALLNEATQYATENKQNVITVKAGLDELGQVPAGESHGQASWSSKIEALRKGLAELEEDFASSPERVDNRTSIVPVMSVRHG